MIIKITIYQNINKEYTSTYKFINASILQEIKYYYETKELYIYSEEERIIYKNVINYKIEKI